MANPANVKSKSLRVALVGAETLLGRELQEVLASRIPSTVLSNYSATAEGTFGEQEGEAVFVDALTIPALADEKAVLVAGTEDGALRAYGLAKDAPRRPLLIDCTGYLEAQPESRINSPLLTGGIAEAGGVPATSVIIVPHPAAAALATVLSRLASRFRMRQVVAQIFEPASERGKRGISELQQQTSGLLAFKPLDKDVFDTQLSFNLLPQYGEAAPTKLLTIEEAIERHTATLLAKQVEEGLLPLPSIRLIQAPVFHGYSLSLWVEFENAVSINGLSEALASAQIEVRGASEEAPTNVGVAGQSGLSAGDIRIDHNNGRAAWLWVVADNLRLTADAVADILSGFGTSVQ